MPALGSLAGHHPSNQRPPQMPYQSLPYGHKVAVTIACFHLKQTRAGQPRIPIPTKSQPRDILCYSPAPEEYLDQGNGWKQLDLAMSSYRTRPEQKQSALQGLLKQMDPLFVLPSPYTQGKHRLGRAQDTHIYFKGHKSQNYSFIINCILFPYIIQIQGKRAFTSENSYKISDLLQ